ncbi:MAG: DUF1214 domain-containing protein [Pirellulaceae bacterium]|nr:DUF1214 domain-containing protein [Pirellulaceae bacterium]
MKLFLKTMSCVVLAALLAFVSGWLLLNRPSEGVTNGVWTTDPTTGSSRAGLYHRARVAKIGIWALDSSEVVYFSAAKDSDGNPLRHDGTYKITGNDPDTRWWSVTAYNDDHFIPNPLNRYSYSKTTVEREADGSWVIMLSPKKQEKNWLPSGDQQGALVVSLRNYNPSRTMIDSPGKVELPKLVKERNQ